MNQKRIFLLDWVMTILIIVSTAISGYYICERTINPPLKVVQLTKAPLPKDYPTEDCPLWHPVMKAHLNIIVAEDHFFCYVHNAVLNSQLFGFPDAEQIPIPRLSVLNKIELTRLLACANETWPNFTVKFAMTPKAPFHLLVDMIELMHALRIKKWAFSDLLRAESMAILEIEGQ
jgi:hypothetical protein